MNGNFAPTVDEHGLRFWVTRYRKFRAFLGPLIWMFFILSLMVGLGGFAVEFSFVYVLQGFFKTIGLVAGANLFLPSWYPDGLVFNLALLLAFGILRSFVLFGKTFLGGMIQQSFIKEQRENILQAALRNQSRFTTTGIVTSFTDRVTQGGSFVQAVSQVLIMSMTSVLLACSALWLAPAEFMVGSIFFAIFFVPMRRMNHNINRSARGIASEWGQITKTLLFGIRNSFLLKLYDRNEAEIVKGRTALQRYLNHFYDYYRVLAMKSIFPNVIGMIGITLITFVSLKIGHTPPMRLVSLFYIFLRLSQNLSELGTYSSDARVYFESFKNLYALILDAKTEAPAPAAKTQSFSDAPLVFRELEMRNLSFGFEPRQTIFKSMNLKMGPHEIVVIKGESGVGKSTLISLMSGLLEPTAGSVLVNGRPLSQIRASFANVLGYVGPEPYIFPGTIRDNLLYPDQSDTTSDGRLWESLEQSQIGDLIRSRDQGLQTILTEDSNLSTGQKQRLSLARALLRNPAILILDEATANIDLETETKIKSLLLTLKSRMLVIIISHRPTFDDIADQKVFLHYGRDHEIVSATRPPSPN